ncbi:methylamine utilization protein MauG [Marinomonas sp. 15G1-11]|uniref:Methylamine utilization protein MauG n=1 Tax=Marinomonas phaeophyticola TaxID=3004091 RepID=A0ABT4JYL3_9GAMM|nr:cytochrome c peroxidase [Marinomonas sp. 15G1-11]MCZ2723477.1 methylamine utilization protein MauG [Marinomonas sp. 15G1-11]
MASTQKSLSQLGAALYFDVNLSKYRNQSCATCHNPQKGFIDDRDNGVFGAVSLGSDNHSLGDRNAPTASYAALTPVFHKNAEGNFVGGQFHDGRESTLADQAGGPPLNPIEMGMKSKEEVASRLKENVFYIEQFKQIFGNNVTESSDALYAAMTQSIMAFEETELFMPFNSKYDRMLRGEVEFTPEEELGKTLFFSQQFTNCNACHQLNTSPFYSKETFTNYHYENIGVPENTYVRSKTEIIEEKDAGLLLNPKVSGSEHGGKFKVPTLRNIMVTGPYMHNGVFQELRTVLEFYDHYNNPSRTINPETGKEWEQAEWPATVNFEELEKGPALTDNKIDALMAFLSTLTDKRFEKTTQ